MGACLMTKKISDERLRNTRNWAEARLGSLSGAEVIVGAIDEVFALRDEKERLDRKCGALALLAYGEIQPIDSPSAICAIIGCKEREEHLHYIAHPPEVAPRSAPELNALDPPSGIQGLPEGRQGALRSPALTLQNAVDDLDTAVERECWEDVGTVIAYMREALAKHPEPEAKCTCEGWRHAGHAPYCALNRRGE